MAIKDYQTKFKYKDLLILSKEIRNNIKTQISTIKSKKILIFLVILITKHK